MAVGPVDVVIIGFPGNNFTGAIAPAVTELVESGTVRVLDLLFVSKDGAGAVTALELTDLDPETARSFMGVDIVHAGALGAEDAEELSDDLAPNSSALAIAFENVWAGRFVEAVRAADGVVIDQLRIPVDAVDAVMGLGSQTPVVPA